MQNLWGKDRATRRYLSQLLPRGYGQQACKIAGMRKLICWTSEPCAHRM
jgi:sulfur relay (sulfurtransferase) DsrC/TusE family protein